MTKKLVGNAKIEKFKCDILSHFQRMWAMYQKIKIKLSRKKKSRHVKKRSSV